jgi:hypothetical protein
MRPSIQTEAKVETSRFICDPGLRFEMTWLLFSKPNSDFSFIQILSWTLFPQEGTNSSNNQNSIFERHGVWLNIAFKNQAKGTIPKSGAK